MITRLATSTSAAELRDRLRLLAAEQAQVALSGLEGNETYMADLRDDLAATLDAYVGMAVTEIAALRGELGQRGQG